MAEKDKDFLERLLSTFRIEAEEHLKRLTDGLLELEKTPAADKQAPIVENVFREAHSLKGAARAVNMTDIETLCQSLESTFAVWKRKELAPSPELFDLLHQVVDSLAVLLASPDTNRTQAARAHVRELGEKLAKAQSGPPRHRRQKSPKKQNLEPPSFPPAGGPRVPVEDKPVSAETVRIATAKLDAVFLKTEELLSAKLTAGQHASELREVNTMLAAWKTREAKIKLDVAAIRRNFGKSSPDSGMSDKRFQSIVEFFDWNHHAIAELESKLAVLNRSAEQDHRALGAMVDDLLADMKKVLMLPFGSILDSFPRLVRDLSRYQGKQADLVIEGEEIEVDRRILEEIKDPLIHLIRNCIDHGIESAEERQHKGKPSRGTIRIGVSQKNGSKVQILISDDGRGIDLEKVRASALKLGSITQQEAESLGEQETLALIFRSGVSTSPMITDLSGRGLGLAIVREKAEKLEGSVAVESFVGARTTFRIVLPLTITTFRGIPVRVDEHLFVFPSTQVEGVVQVKREKIKTVENRETIEFDGKAVALVHLGDALELPRTRSTDDSKDLLQVVLITLDEKRIAFVIDEVLNGQEVLVKNLGRQLLRVRNIAGATALASRKLVPILNISDLMKSAVKLSGVAGRAASATPSEKEKRKSVLVVEDSITARTLIKSILEAAGYDVKTAVDGVDGFTQLRSGEFDVLVSDVEMPRMNGFDLTAKIRADKKLGELPVILVTALQTPEDRERGIDVGANAYIVKSSFDQSNLLEAVRRLV